MIKLENRLTMKLVCEEISKIYNRLKEDMALIKKSMTMHKYINKQGQHRGIDTQTASQDNFFSKEQIDDLFPNSATIMLIYKLNITRYQLSQSII